MFKCSFALQPNNFPCKAANINKGHVFKGAHTQLFKDILGAPFPLYAFLSSLDFFISYITEFWEFSIFRPCDVCLPYLSMHPFLSDSNSPYSRILPFCCGVAVNQVCEMEMRTLALSHSQSPPLSRHQNEAMPPMFFSDLGVLPNLISGAERGRERCRKRVSRMQRKERRRRTKR